MCLSLDESIVMDIGAYSGIYSLVAASTNQKIEIHAFEPHPNTFKVLKNNIAVNPFENIFLNNFALSDNDGEILFYNSLGNAPSGFSAVNHRNINKNSTTKICNGKDVLKILNTDLYGKRISLIKIDIERAELPLLSIMIDRIIHDRTIVLSEILDEEDFEHFDELFAKNGFYAVKINDQDHTIKILNSLKGTKREGFNIIFAPSEVDPKIFY
jgi:FkbM family methyltransferase